ncbi:lamin tail domain-containing protein [Nitrosarchaeum sp.]|uniref:lamin tail domain-containing protein n=1 Tax=Nitrosarchaeum sp. TaxID=2026886 RepID=UPI00247CDC7E|nr:lamin tail domain-containing protein [Nitrosarchaeum sp.]MCV0412213.1 lamin tail domain-containing protein [Nitrosarchaeum sp.]
MKNILVLFSILLLGGLAVTASAQSSTNHVVINEIDINPPGDDSKSVLEWVEIYNPTSSKVDISGWQIASTTALKKTMTISSGTFIEPGKYLTFSYQSLWFADSNELVELRDKNGVVIDKTPLLSDPKNDLTSWQRIYDGYDFDNSNDWKFAIPTAGSSNGKVTTTETKTDVTVTVSTNKESYLFGETASITGKISKQVFITAPYFHADEISVKITGPKYDKTISLYPDLNLNYKTSLNLQQVLGINKGVYLVSVTYGGATSQTSFTVGDEVIPDVVVKNNTLSIVTDKSQYLPGDTLSLTGITTEAIPFEGLKFNIKDPNGKIISTGSLYPTNGKFSTNVYITPVNPAFGTYQITAEYFDKSALTFFEVVKDTKEEKAISIWTDKDAYALGETVTITGRLNNVWVQFMNLEILQTKNTALATAALGGGNSGFKILDTIKISGDGTFSYSFKIPDSNVRLGDYKISVSQSLGSASKTIHAVANPDDFIVSSNPISISTDKLIYNLGDTMTISGYVKNPVLSSTYQTASVVISISHEDGRPLEIVAQAPNAKTRLNNGLVVAYEFTATPDPSGKFSVQTKVLKNAFAEGNYKIKAEYRGLTTSASVGILDPLKLSSGALISLNKQVYGLGEPVVLSGILPPTGASSVTISLTKPDGSIVNSGATVDNQRFSWSWMTPITEKPLTIKTDDRSVTKSNYGIYKIRVSIASAGTDVFFKVSSDPANDSLTLVPLYVTTEKSLYKAGEKLKVIGNIIKRDQGSEGLVVPDRVTIRVLDNKTPFKQISEASVYPDQGGNFQSSFELPVTVFKEGEYKIKALYSGKQSESVFTIANDFSIGSSDKLSLLLATDKSDYYPGDTVTVSGKPNKLIYLEKFDVSVIQKKEGEITCGTFYCGKHVGKVTTIRPSSSGSFSHEIIIPNMPSSIGSYEITVDAGFQTKSIMFNVIEKPVVVEPVKVPSILIDKVNRISEDKISIITNEKTVDDKQAFPRVLSGSLLSSKVDQSNVNLRITSESGICIIGQDVDCLVQNSTRKPGQIYDVVSVDGIELNVRYSGPDVYLEKFDILPVSSDGFLPNANWNVDIIKEDQISRFYYKINYKMVE